MGDDMLLISKSGRKTAFFMPKYRDFGWIML